MFATLITAVKAFRAMFYEFEYVSITDADGTELIRVTPQANKNQVLVTRTVVISETIGNLTAGKLCGEALEKNPGAKISLGSKICNG